MAVYEIPVWKMLDEIKNELPKVFKRNDVIRTIHSKYGANVKKSTIQAHVTACSDHPSSKHYAISKHRIFHYLGNGNFTLDENYVPTEEISTDEELLPEIDEEEDIPETTFTLEKDLEEFIYRNLDQMEEGLKPHSDKDLSRQYTTEVGRLDILALDKNEDLVVIELKAGRASGDVVGQILGYMAWVRENMAEDKKVRGIVVANSFENRVKYAATEIPNLELKEYVVNFNFKTPEK